MLFSVATSTCPDTINGDAYTSPSTAARHASRGLDSNGVPGPTPVRAGFWWYSGQSNPRPGDRDEAVAEEDGEAAGVWLEEPPHAAPSESNKTTRLAARALKAPS